MTRDIQHHDEITLAILAGGAGSRLGIPKGLLRINNLPIMEYLLDRLHWPGPTLLITAPGREHPPGAQRFGREAVDAVAGQGPLRGILTALESTATPLVIITAVDMPLIQRIHLDQLVEQFRARSALLGLMTCHSENQRRRIEPFPGIFHIDAAAALIERLQSNNTSVWGLVDDPLFTALDLRWDPATWLNINSPADVEQMSSRGLRITGFQAVSEQTPRVGNP